MIRRLLQSKHELCRATRNVRPSGAQTRCNSYRPLPALRVAWDTTNEDIKAAQESAKLRRMPFSEMDALQMRKDREELRMLNIAIRIGEKQQKDNAATIEKFTRRLKTEPDLAPHLERVKDLARANRTKLKELRKGAAVFEDRLLEIRKPWPNRIHSSTPIGPEENASVITFFDARCKTHGVTAKDLPCSATELSSRLSGPLPVDPGRDHLKVADGLKEGGIDRVAGNLSTGPSWPYMTGTVSLLEQAITQYALSIIVPRGFIITSVPDVIKSEVAERCGFRPRDEASSQTYYVDTSRSEAEIQNMVFEDMEKFIKKEHGGLCLAGTAEIPLAALLANQMYHCLKPGERNTALNQLRLPIKLVALGHAFRAEAGARGTDTRGLYRVHQFSKVEMFAVTEPGLSGKMLRELRGIQERIVRGLGLMYRVLDMPTEELGASAFRKVDIEAWMPGRGDWGEVSSASNCTDYQAARLNIRYKPNPLGEEKPKVGYAHTLNATGAAIPRLIVAILETYGHHNGCLILPDTLRPFWLGGPEDPRVIWKTPKTQVPSPDTFENTESDLPTEDNGSIDFHQKHKPTTSVEQNSFTNGSSASTAEHSSVQSIATNPKRGYHTRRVCAPIAKGTKLSPLTHRYPIHTSTKRSRSFQQYKQELEKRAAEHGASPGSLVLAFVLLHELTAILPLFGFAFVFVLLGAGDSILNGLEAIQLSLLPEDADNLFQQKLHEYITRGTKVATRMCSRCNEYLSYPTESPNSPVAVWLSSLTAAYVLVKLLVPIRLGLCFALAPWFVRRVLSPLRNWKRIIGRRR
ncbi:serine--tRNA ligase [Malassezia yamatoensis]|uniref:serine--tRNA ligase n=1 Tax=Malassezia yamatoensis TaxID=253288 RepID=A0AAJ6CIP3_9BASI|nr:serine--tRNA ligase [Malassezia yamatoensis]